ncbi:hypothetical protein HYQ46_007382 [Verticillium longisporum]|nr:hypothetical protein HYQ46_007382 [Verticillium longisporum]
MSVGGVVRLQVRFLLLLLLRVVRREIEVHGSEFGLEAQGNRDIANGGPTVKGVVKVFLGLHDLFEGHGDIGILAGVPGSKGIIDALG